MIALRRESGWVAAIWPPAILGAGIWWMSSIRLLVDVLDQTRSDFWWVSPIRSLDQRGPSAGCASWSPPLAAPESGAVRSPLARGKAQNAQRNQDSVDSRPSRGRVGGESPLEVECCDMRFELIRPAAAMAVLAISGLALAGPTFDEPPGGDAGTSRDDAKDVKTDSGQGPVGLISGSLTGTSTLTGYGDYQDVYRIYIADPTMFRAETYGDIGSNNPLHNPMLYLFNEAGQGIMANDNEHQDTGMSKLVNEDASGQPIFTGAGIYYLAITSGPSEALTEIGNDPVPIFGMGMPGNDVGLVLPRPEYGSFSWTGWTNPDFENFGDYEIGLGGVMSLPIPAPGAIALIGLAAIRGRRRR